MKMCEKQYKKTFCKYNNLTKCEKEVLQILKTSCEQSQENKTKITNNEIVELSNFGITQIKKSILKLKKYKFIRVYTYFNYKNGKVYKNRIINIYIHNLRYIKKRYNYANDLVGKSCPPEAKKNKYTFAIWWHYYNLSTMVDCYFDNKKIKKCPTINNIKINFNIKRIINTIKYLFSKKTVKTVTMRLSKHDRRFINKANRLFAKKDDTHLIYNCLLKLSMR